MEKLYKLNFYPGPSRLYDSIPQFAQEGFAKGILSMNHRSIAFEELYRITQEKLFTALNVPEGYHLAFVSSATECWEIISQSLTQYKSYHAYNGNFGKKWFEYAHKIKPDTEAFEYSVDALLKPEEMDVPLDNEWICLTQNETSNGTQVQEEVIKEIRHVFPDQFIAVDATSSLGGIELSIVNADIWFASVQKCFGLPSGMGLLIYSDHVLAKAEQLGEIGHYNSFLNIASNAAKFQTQYTPNILAIYLLFRVLENIPNVQKTDEIITTRAQHLYQYFQGFGEFQTITQNPFCYSDTVLAFKGEERLIANIKKTAQQHGIILGNGYGDWKNDSFRIANFPAIPNSEFEQLVNFFDHYSD